VLAGGWFHLEDPFGPDRFDRVISKPGAASFTVGMPNYAAVYTLNAALDYIHAIGVQAIADCARPLVQACMAGLKKLPVEVITPDEPDALAGIISFRHPEAERVHRILHERDIHIMCTAGRMRVAIHGYNTMADVERFLQVLQKALEAS